MLRNNILGLCAHILYMAWVSAAFYATVTWLPAQVGGCAALQGWLAHDIVNACRCLAGLPSQELASSHLPHPDCPPASPPIPLPARLQLREAGMKPVISQGIVL